MNLSMPYAEDSVAANAWAVLSVFLIVAACLVADAVVGARSLDVGTDTHVYAGVFLAMRDGLVQSRFEPGFLLVTRLLSATGMSVEAYQATLFAISLMAASVAARRYFNYLGGESGYLTFLTASLMCLFLSPMFVNGSINAVRQGTASLLVFVALLAFHRRRWRGFFLYGALASSFHYSSLLYLAFAPVLLLSVRRQRIIAAVGFLIYATGMSMLLVRTAVPSVYVAVMSYSAGATYRAGVRLDFAVFSIFWYLLPYLGSRLVREPFRERIKQGTAVYLVMVLPFLAVGWGNYSNRYLLAPWVSVSFLVAAMAFFARTPLLRNPLILRVGLIAATGVFCYYVIEQVVI